MKVLGILLLFGLAAFATSFQERWERERDNTIAQFMKGMDMAGPLRIALGMPDAYELDEPEEDIKTEIGKKLKEHLDNILAKIKDAIDNGKDVKKDLLDKLKELREKLKDIHVRIGDKAKELLKKLKDRLQEKIKDFIDGLLKDKDEDAFSQALEAAENEIDSKNILEKIKDMIAKHLDIEKIREYLEKIKNNEIVKRLLKLLEKFKDSEALEKLRNFIRKLLDEQPRDRRSLQEYWEKIKEFFKEKHLKFVEKFGALAEWLKDALKKGLEVTKDRITTMKNIAKQVINDSKSIGSEAALEVLEALKPYKDDLHELWGQLQEKVKEIVKRKD